LKIDEKVFDSVSSSSEEDSNDLEKTPLFVNSKVLKRQESNGENLAAVFDDFSRFYAESAKSEVKPRCLILQNNKYKIWWDLFVMIILIFISIVVPFRLAFVEDDDSFWKIAYFVMDICFLIDILLTFFTSITIPETSLECHNHGIIAITYLKSWFLLDVLSILPLDMMLTGLNVNSLFRFARIGKLYKLIRMTRLAKLFKLLKGNKTVISQMTEKL
jgi:hypothetical protein